VDIIEVSGCRYPTGYSDKHLFCNAAKNEAESYCGEHLKLVTRPRQ
jgi:hypothetical protein